MQSSFNKEAAEHQRLQAELDKATEAMKEYERKDIRFQEEIKQLKAKLQKLADKQTKESSKAEVMPTAACAGLDILDVEHICRPGTHGHC